MDDALGRCLVVFCCFDSSRLRDGLLAGTMDWITDLPLALTNLHIKLSVLLSCFFVLAV